mmetsp:Transcript_2815/g.7890  ORF Transcript_2815/g.7890 Transcript_2815/m.7890 type:complete len:520 (+) Transcript_2815:348-1907(+)
MSSTMDHNPHSIEEHAAASAVAALAADSSNTNSNSNTEGAASLAGAKRGRDDEPTAHSGSPAAAMMHQAPPTKMRMMHHGMSPSHQPQVPQAIQQQQQQYHHYQSAGSPHAAASTVTPDQRPRSVVGGGAGAAAAAAVAKASMPTTSNNSKKNPDGTDKALEPYPYFYYRNFSAHQDPDPLTPLTQPGRVPNFVAKMHAILSRPDLTDVVAWMPHGRSWRVLKPREFEIRVIPTYFEHAKFSSFIRQANGWGFRRITQGRDRNSYYHEMFLRGLPHLCKMMKRPGVSEKQAADPEHEPDLYKISEDHPIPEKSDDDSVMLQCTLQGGPKARMPIYLGAFSSGMDGQNAAPADGAAMGSAYDNINPTPLNAFNSGNSSTGGDGSFNHDNHDSHIMEMNQFLSEGKTDAASAGMNYAQQFLSSHVASNYSDFAQPSGTSNGAENPIGSMMNGVVPSVAAAAYQASSAASQFAAGFAAATALSHQQLRAIVSPDMDEGQTSGSHLHSESTSDSTSDSIIIPS